MVMRDVSIWPVAGRFARPVFISVLPRWLAPALYFAWLGVADCCFALDTAATVTWIDPGILAAPSSEYELEN